jgi:O-antigen ligase
MRALIKYFTMIRFVHISALLVGLMCIVPFLDYHHGYPLTTFNQEGWSIVLGLLAAIFLVSQSAWREAQVPRIILLPLLMAVLVLAQMAMGKIAYFAQGKLFLIYLLFAALMMLLGAALRRTLGIEKLTIALGFFLLIGAELNALIGFIQHFHLDTSLNGVILQKNLASLSGNLAQPNHYADYIAIGIVSLGLLFQQGKIKLHFVVMFALPLLFVLTLSASRSSWLYIFMLVATAWWFAYKNKQLTSLKLYSVGILLGFLIMHGVVQLPFMAEAGNQLSTFDRFLGHSDANGAIRLVLWQQALTIWLQAPLSGVGFGQFGVHHLALLPTLNGHAQLPGYWNNAHNLVIHIAVEAGVIGLIIFFGTLACWFYGLRRASNFSASHWWAIAALGVLAIHSLLEYPLWYAYFLAIASLLLGVLDEQTYGVEKPLLSRVSIAMIVGLGAILIVQFERDYALLSITLNRVGMGVENEFSREIYRDNITHIPESSFLYSYAMYFSYPLIVINTDNLPAKINLINQSTSFLPTANIVFLRAYLLAKNNQVTLAQAKLKEAIWSYPHNVEGHNLLMDLARQDPAHFAALLEFATQKQQEYDLAVRP